MLDLEEFWKSLTGVKSSYLPLLIFLMLLANLFRALRWRILLPSKNRPTIPILFEGIFVGFTATFLLPLRAGEFVRAFYVARLEKLSFSSVFASIVTERIFDILSLLVLLGACLGFMPSVPSFVSIGVQSLSVLVVLVAILIAAAYRKPRTILEVVYKCTRLLPSKKTSKITKKILFMTKEFTRGLHAIGNLREALLVVLYSAGVWFTVCCFYWFCVPAMGEQGSLAVGAVTTALIALAVAAPSAPGFLGTYQVGCVVALSGIFSFNESFAVAYSLFTHIIQAALIIGLGLYFLARRGLRLRDFLH